MPDLDDMPGLAALRRVTRGDASVHVVIVDGPCDLGHSCFAGAAIQAAPVAVAPDEPLADLADHATAIASLIAGQPGTPVEGIAPGVRVTMVEGARTVPEAESEVRQVQALEAALSLRPDILHYAFCMASRSGVIGDLLQRALQKAAAAGVLVVAPAGNNSGDCYCAPADQPEVLAVGGLDDDGTVRKASNFGDAYRGHGVMAWAENLLGALSGERTRRQSGTSGAAAVVSGVAALLLSAAREAGRDVSPPAVGEAIRATARPLQEPDQRERAIGGVIAPEAALAALSPEAAPTGGAELSAVRLPSRLFALGGLAVDVPGDGARERLAARMGARLPDRGLDLARPHDLRALCAHLREHPQDATLVTWVLGQDGAPRYGLEPRGPHAAAVERRLIAVLGAGLAAPAGAPAVERVSVAGAVTVRRVQLSDGLRVPVAVVDRPQGISAWRTADLVSSLVPPGVDDPAAAAIGDLLALVYDHHRNDGTRAPDRALNFAATNAVQAAVAVRAACARGLRLERLAVEKSRFDRPRSNCWDIQAWFADPDDEHRARRVWVWTVDVADVLPVSIRGLHSWPVPGRDGGT